MKQSIQMLLAALLLAPVIAFAQPSENIRQHTLHFLLAEKGKLFAYQGELKNILPRLPDPIMISDSAAIVKTFQSAQQYAKEKGQKFFVAIKPSSKTDYKTVVDMLDWVVKLNVKYFSQMELTQEEQNAFGLKSGFGANGEMELKDENDAAAEINMLDLKGYILLFEVISENEVKYNTGLKIDNAKRKALDPFTIENINKTISLARAESKQAGKPLKVVIYGKKTLKNKNVKILTTTLKANSIYKFDIIGEDEEGG